MGGGAILGMSLLLPDMMDEKSAEFSSIDRLVLLKEEVVVVVVVVVLERKILLFVVDINTTGEKPCETFIELAAIARTNERAVDEKTILGGDRGQ
jgi:hypothetical protein